MKQHKLLSLLLLTLLSCNLLRAQEQELSPVMSLSACVSYAQEHSPLLLPVENRVRMLDITHSAARQAFLPSLNASIGEDASFGRSQGIDGVYSSVNSANTSFQIGGQLSLFEGGRKWFQLKKSQAALETAGYIVNETMDNIALQVTSSYISLLLAKQIAAIAEENLALSLSQLDQVRTQVELGKLPRSREIEMESQVGRDELNVAETRADVERATRTLLLDMGVPTVGEQEVGIQFLASSPEKIVERLNNSNPNRINSDWVLPTTYLLQKEVEMAQYDIKSAKAAFWPSLSLTGGYSNAYYYMFGDSFQSRNLPFSDQLHNNGRGYIGLSLNIPIYAQGQRQFQVRQAQIQEANLRSQLVQRQFEDTRNITLAETDLKKAEEQYRVSRQNVELTTRALEIADKEYQAGRTTTYEWDQAKNRRAQAQATYMQAIYNRLLRTINLTYFRTGEIPLHLAE